MTVHVKPLPFFLRQAIDIYIYKQNSTGTVILGGDFVGGLLAVCCSDLRKIHHRDQVATLLMMVICFDIRLITRRVVYINVELPKGLWNYSEM